MSDRLNLADLKIQSPKELLSIAEELEIDAQGRDDVLDPKRAR
jgi:hypothetical protein